MLADVEVTRTRSFQMLAGQLTWTWSGKTIDLGLDQGGQGPTVLLLPALSSIATRREMRPLQERLSGHYGTVSIDWPGFGYQPRPPSDWTPEACRAFLRFTVDAVAQTTRR